MWGRVSREESLSHLACWHIWSSVITLSVVPSYPVSPATSTMACSTLGALSSMLFVSVR